MIVLTELLWPSSATLSMPVTGEPRVELYCHQPLPGFLLPLIPNLFLVIACAVLGFLSRKLPENYNESWYIFVSVSTILFMWSVFIPTYFSAFYASHKVGLLALCLLINSVITIGCQFAPKLYVAMFVTVEKIDVVETSMSLTSVQPQTG